jgi:hypothetical protein
MSLGGALAFRPSGLVAPRIRGHVAYRKSKKEEEEALCHAQ